MESLISGCPVFVHNHNGTDNGIRWAEWLENFENYLIVLGVTNEARKVAFMKHFMGDDARRINSTLTKADDTYDELKKVMSSYYNPQKNIQFAVYKFREAKQEGNELMAEFITRLRILGKDCAFQDLDKEIKSQLVQNCSIRKLRLQILANENITIKEILDAAYMYESISKQADEIEQTDSQVNKITIKYEKTAANRNQTSDENYKSTTSKCRRCGLSYPHKADCPAKDKKCMRCNKFNHFARCCKSRPDSTNKDYKAQNFDKHGAIGEALVDRNKDRAESNCANAILASDTMGNNYQIDSRCDQDKSFTIRNNSSNVPSTVIQCCGTDIRIIIDSGASANILDEQTFVRLLIKPQLKPASTFIYSYNSTEPLKTLGEFEADVTFKENKVVSKFNVVKGNSGNLLSFTTSQQLKIIQFSYLVEQFDPIAEFPSLFSTKIGKLKDFQLKFYIDSSVKPCVQPCRRVPFSERPKVEAEIKQMLEEDIIEPATGPTTWVSPIVVVPKRDPNEIRICIDARMVNTAIKRERAVTPTLDDIITELNGAAMISKIDLVKAFHQIELHPESRQVTTFCTHIGYFRYKRLFFGVNSATESFQQVIYNLLHDIQGTLNISDDILVHGKTEAEHNQRLRAVLKRLQEAGLTANPEKCEFNKQNINFFGMNFSCDGVKLDDRKIKAIIGAQNPQDASELRSFLGLATYCCRFIPNFASISAPLWDLTKKTTKWQWTEEHENSMKLLKEALVTDGVSYFNPEWITELCVDAGPNGLGAILCQRKPDGDEKQIVAYASRTLSQTEKNYSQNEREALAVVYGCEKFHLYLIGRHFTLITDNRAVQLILKNPKSTPPARIARWNLRLSQYDFSIKHHPGKYNIADYLSRRPIEETDEYNHCSTIEAYVNYVATKAIPKALRKEDLLEQINKDALLNKVKEMIQNGKQYQESELKPYQKIKAELCVTHEGFILKQNKIIIPQSLEKHILELAHESHQGNTSTKRLIRQKIWFPNMDAKIEKFIQSCLLCQSNNKAKTNAPVIVTEPPMNVWLNTSIDFYGPLPSNEYLMVLIDDLSKYPIVTVIRSISAQTVIDKLDTIFTAYGIPETLKSDNGPPFSSGEFKDFAQRLGFKHQRITPYWPQANGEVERFMRTIGKVVRIAIQEKEPLNKAINKFLRNYYSTPHSATNIAPADLMFNYRFNNKLPLALQSNETVVENDLIQKARKNSEEAKLKMKTYADNHRKLNYKKFEVGDNVLIKQQQKSKYKPPYSVEKYVITNINGTTVTAKSKQGHVVTRNVSHFKFISNNETGCENNNKLVNKSYKANHFKVELNELNDDFDFYFAKQQQGNINLNNQDQVLLNTSLGTCNSELHNNNSCVVESTSTRESIPVEPLLLKQLTPAEPSSEPDMPTPIHQQQASNLSGSEEVDVPFIQVDKCLSTLYKAKKSVTGVENSKNKTAKKLYSPQHQPQYSRYGRFINKPKAFHQTFN